MKPTELLKVTAIVFMTSGLIAGCQQSSTTSGDGDGDRY